MSKCECQTHLGEPRQQMAREGCIKELFMFLTKYYGNQMNRETWLGQVAGIEKRILVGNVRGP